MGVQTTPGDRKVLVYINMMDQRFFSKHLNRNSCLEHFGASLDECPPTEAVSESSEMWTHWAFILNNLSGDPGQEPLKLLVQHKKTHTTKT